MSRYRGAFGAPAGMLALLLCISTLSAKERYWERFPTPPGRADFVHCVGVDRNGQLWAMAGTGLYSWDSEKLQWSQPILRSGLFLTQMYGSPKTGLYATARDKAVYLLQEGKATYVTDYEYDKPGEQPGFRVTRDGRLLNWGQGKLRIFSRGRWHEHPAELPQAWLTLIFDAGKTIHAYFGGRLYSVDRKNRFSEVKPDLQGMDQAANPLKGAMWGRKKAIFLQYNAPHVRAVRLDSGRSADSGRINSVLGDRNVYDLFPAPDGSVWILALDRFVLHSHVLFRVSPNGSTKMVPTTAGLAWDNHRFSQYPKSILAHGKHEFWFANREYGMFALRRGRIEQFDARIDNSPYYPTQLAGAPKGVVYAAGLNGVYAYNRGRSLTGRPPEILKPPESPGDPVWELKAAPSRLRMAWRAENLILASYGKHEILALNPKNGQLAYSIPLDESDRDPWVSRGGREGEMTLGLKNRILTLNAADGATLRDLYRSRDRRSNPVALSDGTIVASLDRTAIRLTSTGRIVWIAPLPGEVMTHLACREPYLLVQTRRSDYGGQATVAIDSRSGKELWRDTVNAYGAGAVFASDCSFSVETDTYLSPDRLEAWLIARNPATGERLWHFRRPGTTVRHPPLLEAGTVRVYAVLENGQAVCVDGRSGTLLWEHPLPQPPQRARDADDHPYHPVMSLTEGCLMIWDRSQVLNLLDPSSGALLRRISPTEDIIRHGNRYRTDEMVALPWVTDGLLIVPSQSGIKAFRWK